MLSKSLSDWKCEYMIKFNTKVIVYSTGRCGTTLVSQILSGLPNITVRPSHTLVRNIRRRKMIVPYRDFRDVLVSQWRVKNDISKEEIDSGRRMTSSELEEMLVFMEEQIRIMEKNVRSNPHCLLLKYEQFYNDFEFLYDRIESYLGQSYSVDLREHLSTKFSLKANESRASQMDSFEKWDDNGIHGHHILTGKEKTWMGLIAPSDYQTLNNGLAKSLEDWGYSIQ